MDLLERRGDQTTRHPWETARVEAVARILARSSLTGPRVLDVGSGDAFVIDELGARLGFADAVAQDIHLSNELMSALERPGRRLVRELSELGEQRFDLILLLDVLEHIKEPEALLSELCSERLADGGFVLVTVPAFQLLFTQHDTDLRHFRRYSRHQICQLLDANGLRVRESGYLFASLLVPRALGKLREQLLPPRPRPSVGIGAWRGSKRLTGNLHRALALDNRLCLWFQQRGVTLPGLSAWALCNRR